MPEKLFLLHRNYETISLPAFCIMNIHTYNGCLGWQIQPTLIYLFTGKTTFRFWRNTFQLMCLASVVIWTAARLEVTILLSAMRFLREITGNSELEIINNNFDQNIQILSLIRKFLLLRICYWEIIPGLISWHHSNRYVGLLEAA